MYQHQFIDPSQTNINYLNLSLIGSSGTSNNNSSCFEPDPSSLFRMLQPSINFNDVGSYLNENTSISGTVSPTSAAMYWDLNAGFNYPLIPSNGIDINGEHLFGFKGEGIDIYGGDINENIMVKSGSKKRKNSGKGGVKNEKDRRLRLSKQYEVLKTVIPNPTKPDRATIVQDTIDHIHELLCTMDELKLLIEQKRVRKVSMNSPHNPAGKVFTKEELQTIAIACRDMNCFAVTYEMHITIASLLGMQERTIITSSLSKTFSVTGWRFGWACAPAKIASAIRNIHIKLTDSAPAPFQEAALITLESPPSYFESLKTVMHHR